MMEAHAAPLSGKKIGVFGKGGAGKSTSTVLLAKALRRKGYSTCILDADSTNVGLHYALGIAEPPDSLLDFYGGPVFVGGSVTCPVDDPTPLPGAEISLNAMPSRYYAQSPEGIYLLLAGKLGERGPGAGCDGPISKIARDLIIRGPGEPLVVLVDFKAGFEDSARGVVTSLDWALVVVDPTQAAIQLAGHMRDMVEKIQEGALPATRHLEDAGLVELANQLYRQARIKGVWAILNRARDEQTERFMRAALKERDIEPMGVFGETSDVVQAWLRGETLEAAEFSAEADETVAQMERAEEKEASIASKTSE